MTDIEGKKKIEYNAERKAEADRELKDVVDKIKTYARAVAWNLTFPTSVSFDANGSMYIAESTIFTES